MFDDRCQMQTHSISMKTKLILLTLALTFACALLAQQQPRNPVTRPPGSARPNTMIISKLSEIVTIRERIAKDYELLLATGRAPADSAAEIELAEARIALAEERGHDDMIVTELKSLVAVHERRAKKFAALAKDRVTPGDADRAQAAFLEAQVRLLRAQK
jgi:hypothetical protein